MVARVVNFFETCGGQSTQAVMDLVVRRAVEGDIDAVVVASTAGATAIRVAEEARKAKIDTKVVCVTGPPHHGRNMVTEFR
jgi:hypothetical protein